MQDERPYVCEQCSKSFKDKSLLIRHKRTHGKDRPFSCAHCNRVFLSKSELKRHLTVHSDEKPFSCEYCQTVFRRKDNLNRHIRHHHSEDSTFESAKPENLVPEQSTKLGKTKQLNPKQKQKPKKAQRISNNSLPKSPAKVSVVYVSSRDQINSRLDSMGNITPVIRMTSELSNAVPVINGPISIKRPEEKTDTRKKTFTYTEPIPLAEAVVINRRIEEKLYTQNVSNRNYFFRGCLTCNDKTYPTVASQSLRANSFNANFLNPKTAMNKAISQDNPSLEPLSGSRGNSACQNNETVKIGKDCVPGREENVKGKNQEKSESLDKQFANKEPNGDGRDLLQGGQQPVSNKQINCVSTIKKHIVQQMELNSPNQITTLDSHFKMVNNALPRKAENINEKKQSNVHWRRRMTETLKPSNQSS